MSGIDDLNFEDLIDSALNSALDDVETERFEAKQLFQPKPRKGLKTPVLSGKGMASNAGAKMSNDDTVEVLEDTARMQSIPDDISKNPSTAAPPPTPGPATFEQIYARAGLQESDFTVFRLAELYGDEDLADLDEKGRLAAVRAILKSHGVDLATIVADAVGRAEALNTHDAGLKANIHRVEREKEAANEKLQADIEKYANPRIERMEKNNDGVERLRRDYRDWFDHQQTEHDRIALILEPWGTADQLRPTQRSEAVTGSTVVSADDAFEPQVTSDPGELADQWGFDDASVVSEAGDVSSVGTELPSTFSSKHEAGATSTGEFGFMIPKLRVPRTVGQWLMTALALFCWVIGGLILTAQLSTALLTPAAFGVAFGSPLLLAIVISLGTRQGNNWSFGLVSMLLVSSLFAFGAAHADPANLVKNLTTRPLRFVDEAGLNEQIEAAVYGITGPYAALIAAPLGVADAIAKPTEDAPAAPASAAPSK